MADASADPFAEQAAPAAPAFTETPAQDNSFAYAPSPVVEAPPAPVPSGPSPYKCALALDFLLRMLQLRIPQAVSMLCAVDRLEPEIARVQALGDRESEAPGGEEARRG